MSRFLVYGVNQYGDKGDTVGGAAELEDAKKIGKEALSFYKFVEILDRDKLVLYTWTYRKGWHMWVGETLKVRGRR